VALKKLLDVKRNAKTLEGPEQITGYKEKWKNLVQ
jgi:hypothetical protein